MSITFTIQASTHCQRSWRCPACAPFELNLCNRNALDLLAWLGLEPALGGEIAPAELAARCRRRLWPEPRNLDPGLEAVEEGRVLIGGRPAGYLHERTAQLLRLAERALATRGTICWA